MGKPNIEIFTMFVPRAAFSRKRDRKLGYMLEILCGLRPAVLFVFDEKYGWIPQDNQQGSRPAVLFRKLSEKYGWIDPSETTRRAPSPAI